MNIYNTFPWEVYAKIVFLDASVIILNSQVGNSDFKKKIRKLPSRQYIPIKKWIFLNTQKQVESETKLCHFHMLKHILQRGMCLFINWIQHESRAWQPGLQGKVALPANKTVQLRRNASD